MGRRLSAVLLATLLAFAITSCGGDSDDSSSDDGTTTQTDTGGTGDTQDADGNDDTDGNDQSADDRAQRRQERREERREAREERREQRQEQREKRDDNSDGDDDSALPDDLPSEDSADTDDLPIAVDAVMQTCEDVDPADTWPSEDDVYFDTSGGSNVVATAEVETKGGKTVKIACDIAGSEQNPQVMAYSPV